MARAKTTLLQGTLDLIVLQLLRAEPTNGYDLMLRIQAISKDVLNVNAGSLYPALYRLEEQEGQGLFNHTSRAQTPRRRTRDLGTILRRANGNSGHRIAGLIDRCVEIVASGMAGAS